MRRVDFWPPESPQPPPVEQDDQHADLPPQLADPQRPPDPAVFLPPLQGYLTDDDAESGELESSLDHGSVPYLDVRRRIILDEDGFAAGRSRW